MERQYYPLTKAAELSKMDVEDLIHFGAAGKLPIYVFASGLPSYVTVFHSNSTKPFEIYSAETDTTGICKLPIVGLNKLTSNCLQNFELDSDDNLATIDYSGTLKISTDETTIWVRPDPEVKLSIDKFFILQDDMKLLISDSTSDTDTSGRVSRKSLLKLILGMAKGVYKYDPTATRNNKLTEISDDLDMAGMSLDHETIRKILNEASTINK